MLTGSNDEIRGQIIDRLHVKDRVFERRMNVLNFQSKLLRRLVNIAGDKNAGASSSFGYGSGIFHKISNFFTGSKLYPTFISFRHEQTQVGEEAMVQAENISDLHMIMRKKGKYSKAAQASLSDLVRGEAFIRRYIKKGKEGEPKRIQYETIPFDQMRWKYGSEDVIRVVDLTKDAAIKMFGDEVVDDVQPVKSYTRGKRWFYVDNPSIASNKEAEESYTYIHYINEATFEEYEVLGDKIVTKKVGKDYDYEYDDEGFNPYNRRICYQSVEERDFGFGVLDLILPLIRVDDTHGNAIIKRSIDDADPLTIVSSDDPSQLERQYLNHLANRSSRKSGNIFFVQGRGTQSKMDTNQISSGSNPSMFEFVEKFVIERISMLTDVNLRILLEFAPTEAQEGRRQGLQDRVALDILQRNKDTDAEFAKEDIITLLNTETNFHSLKLFFKRSAEEMGGTDEVEALRDKNGELPPKEMTVRDMLKTIKDVEYDIAPRLDGVLDDNTRMEINAQRDDLLLLPQGTPAYAKGIADYFEKTNPKLRITEEDILPPVPELPPEQAL